MESRRTSWPVRSGSVPPLAAAYLARAETGLGPDGALSRGETVMLVPGPVTGEAAWRRGGTGKTQLAAEFAESLWGSGELDLLVWAPAGNRDGLITGLARAFADIRGAAPGGDPELAASRLLEWLARTSRPWLVVLDGLADLADADGLWPRGQSGQAVVTTELGSGPPGAGHWMVPIGGFSERQATGYLSGRLGGDRTPGNGALELATELNLLPLCLALAAASLADNGGGYREYLSAVRGRRASLGSGTTAPAAAALDAVCSLALDRADERPPAGMARPAMALIASLGTDGIPGAVLTSQAAIGYLTAGRVTGPEGERLARASIQNLARLGLVTVDSGDAARTVRAHGLIQAAVRRSLPADSLGQAALAGADAVYQAWPVRAGQPLFEQALRACSASLEMAGGQALRGSGGHPVLTQAGQSLDETGMSALAIAYWERLAAASELAMGVADRSSLRYRELLADAHQAAGHAGYAIELRERALATREKALGSGDPETLAARAGLAGAYQAAGQLAAAVAQYERTAEEREILLGPAHAETVLAREALSGAYLAAGRTAEAIARLQRNYEELEQAYGAGHPETARAVAAVASGYETAGQFQNAIALRARTLADRERALGAAHPGVLDACADLARCYQLAGRPKDAIGLFERVLTARERAQDPDHPDAIAARASLADVLRSARDLKRAILLYELTAAARERAQGPDHPATLAARGDLAAAYHAGRRLPDAIALYEATLGACERALGPEHPRTLTIRANLAHGYHQAGRPKDALRLFDAVAADCERALGPGHPLSGAVRELHQRFLAGRFGAAPIFGTPAP